MLGKLWLFVRKHPYPLILLLMTGIICCTTYKPGTWLTGWDSLHPEFNFSLNFERIINGVWREEQGLGTVAAHAHMSELPRYIILWIFSWIFPTSFLRYFYVFICFMIGPLGVYYFLQYVLHEKEKRGYHLSQAVINASAFLGALFYIFNLNVLHHFLVPFEMFPTKYALLPWLFLFATKYFQTKSKKDLLLFTVATFFSTPMAYAFQLWYVYFGSLGLYLLGLTIAHRSSDHLKRSAIIIGITLAVNSFWLLPHFYFLATAAKYIPEAHSNMLFSERMYAFNKSRGNIFDIAILQGALYDWSKFDGEQFVSLFGNWKGHLDNPFILAIGYGAFGVIIIGLVRLLFHKNTYGYVLIPVALVAFIFMANTSPPFDFFFTYLRDNITLLKEGLRSPYTKFSIMLLFTYCFFFAYAQPVIIEAIGAAGRRMYVSCVAFFLILYMFPLFTGNLIESSMKIPIPKEYFSMFDWFQKQRSDTRIATFPAHSFWGWEYYKWAYQGAGFIWFGLPQSVLVRDFDRWHPGNENFYWEFAYAIYAQNPNLLQAVLHKYHVNWLVIDRNIISPPNPKALYFDEFDELVAKLPFIIKAHSFGDIDVYQVNLEYSSKDWQFDLIDPKVVAPTYHWGNNDQAFHDNGHYISSLHNELQPDIVYPFRTLFTGRAMEKPFLSVEETSDSYNLIAVPDDVTDIQKNYTIATAVDSEVVEVDPLTLEETVTKVPETTLQDNKLVVKLPKLDDYYSYDNTKDPNFDFYEMARCDQSLRGSIERFKTETGMLRFISQNASNCLDLLLPDLSHRFGYLVAIDSDNIAGSPFLFSIQNKDSKKSEADTYFPKEYPSMTGNKPTQSYFVIPPMEYFGQQYALHFDNLSIGNDKSINDLGHIRVQRLPYEFLQTIQWEKNEAQDIGAVHVYAQNFDEGWKAYQINQNSWLQQTLPTFFGHELKEHVLVNNWENGWLVPPDNRKSVIKIVFWPQYLEIIGFGIVILTISGAITAYVWQKKDSNHTRLPRHMRR